MTKKEKTSSDWLLLRRGIWVKRPGETKVLLGKLSKHYRVALTKDLMEWTCEGRLNSPARLNAQGDTQCFSLNNKDCITTHHQACELLKNNPPPNLHPLVCGSMHMKKWGVTGYEEPGHWCRTTRNMLLSGKTGKLLDLSDPKHPKVLAWGVMDGPVFHMKRSARSS